MVKLLQKLVGLFNRFPENLIITGFLLVIVSLITSVAVGAPILSSFEYSVSGIASTIFVVGVLLILISIPIVIAKKAEK